MVAVLTVDTSLLSTSVAGVACVVFDPPEGKVLQTPCKRGTPLAAWLRNVVCVWA